VVRYVNHKIFVLVVTLLMCLSTIVIVPSEFIVEASPGDGGNIGLDYDFGTI